MEPLEGGGPHGHFIKGREVVVGSGDGRPGSSGGKSILLFPSRKGEGGESAGCCLMRGK
jgi:hypothetical protein